MWFTDGVWKALEGCWVPELKSRLSVEGVLQCLEKASRSWTQPSILQAAVPSTINSPMMSTFEITTEQSVSVDRGEVSPPLTH